MLARSLIDRDHMSSLGTGALMELGLALDPETKPFASFSALLPTVLPKYGG